MSAITECSGGLFQKERAFYYSFDTVSYIGIISLPVGNGFRTKLYRFLFLYIHIFKQSIIGHLLSTGFFSGGTF